MKRKLFCMLFAALSGVSVLCAFDQVYIGIAVFCGLLSIGAAVIED